MYSRCLRLLLCAALLVSATGCWDRVEIGDRGFVIGTALDRAEEDKVKVTYQMVIPSALKGEGSSVLSHPYWNLSSQAHTVLKAVRQMSNESSRSPFLEHNQLIIISDELARKTSLAETLDMFIRDPETRRAARVLISEGEADQVLGAKSEIEPLPVLFVNETSKNPDKSETILPPVNIGEMHGYLLQESSFALPRIALRDGDAVVSGAAIINGTSNKMVGILSEEDTVGRNYLKGSIDSGAIEIKVQDHYMVFEVKKARRRISANVSQEHRPEFDIVIEVEGNISESDLHESLLDPDILRDVEDATEAELKRVVMNVVRNAQQKHQSDYLGLGHYLRRKHYAVWQKLVDDWEKGECYFSQSVVKVDVQVKVQLLGLINRSG